MPDCSSCWPCLRIGTHSPLAGGALSRAVPKNTAALLHDIWTHMPCRSLLPARPTSSAAVAASLCCWMCCAQQAAAAPTQAGWVQPLRWRAAPVPAAGAALAPAAAQSREMELRAGPAAAVVLSRRCASCAPCCVQMQAWQLRWWTRGAFLCCCSCCRRLAWAR